MHCYLPSRNKNPHEKSKRFFYLGGFISQVPNFFSLRRKVPQTHKSKLFRKYNSSLYKLCGTPNQQPNFFGRSAPLFRGGYFTGGFYFAMEGTDKKEIQIIELVHFHVDYDFTKTLLPNSTFFFRRATCWRGLHFERALNIVEIHKLEFRKLLPAKPPFFCSLFFSNFNVHTPEFFRKLQCRHTQDFLWKI